MIDTTPVELNDDHIEALADEHLLDDYTVKEFSDIESVLVIAKEVLDIPALKAIALWDTSDDENADLIITVEEPGTRLRLATETITWSSFEHPEAASGAQAVRHVLTEILSYHDRLLTDLAQLVTLAAAPTGGQRADVAEQTKPGGICRDHYPQAKAGCEACATATPRTLMFARGHRVTFDNAPFVIVHVFAANYIYELVPGNDPNAVVSDTQRRLATFDQVTAR